MNRREDIGGECISIEMEEDPLCLQEILCKMVITNL